MTEFSKSAPQLLTSNIHSPFYMRRSIDRSRRSIA